MRHQKKKKKTHKISRYSAEFSEFIAYSGQSEAPLEFMLILQIRDPAPARESPDSCPESSSS